MHLTGFPLYKGIFHISMEKDGDHLQFGGIGSRPLEHMLQLNSFSGPRHCPLSLPQNCGQLFLHCLLHLLWGLFGFYFLLILDFLSLLMAPLQEKQHVRDAQWHSHTSQHYQPLLQPSVSCWKWVLLKFHGTYYPSPKVTLLHLLSLQMSACNIVQKVTITKGSSALDWYRAWKQVMEFQFNLIRSNSKDILAGLQQDSSNYKDNCLHQI